MTPLATWIVLCGVLVVGICIGVIGTVWFIGDETYDDAPPYDDEIEDEVFGGPGRLDPTRNPFTYDDELRD